MIASDIVSAARAGVTTDAIQPTYMHTASSGLSMPPVTATVAVLEAASINVVTRQLAKQRPILQHAVVVHRHRYHVQPPRVRLVPPDPKYVVEQADLRRAKLSVARLK